MPERAPVGLFVPDDRVISVERLDCSGTVLIDAHSLSVLPADLFETPGGRIRLSDFTLEGWCRLASLVQNVVLYDSIVADSLLLEIGDRGTLKACEMFPGIFSCVYLPLGVRRRIGDLISRVAGSDAVGEPAPGVPGHVWAALMRQDATEKGVMDKMRDAGVHFVPREYHEKPSIRTLEGMNPRLRHDLPLACTTSTMTLGRAHFYLELARELDVALSPDPIRSQYFTALFGDVSDNVLRGTPERVWAYSDERILGEAATAYRSIIPQGSVALSIPPVAEYVVRYATRRQCTVYVATMEVRRSKHATEFRKWCARLRGLAREGRPGLKEQTRMISELTNVCKTWSRDISEEVKYKTRILTLEHLGLIGVVLKTLNMQTKRVKDPILKPRRGIGYFLFLNDLYRRPEEIPPTD